MTHDAEIIVAGAGHNGLICAAYLARSGFDVLLLEARDSVGGCASTVEDLGARFNICNCDHTMIRGVPVMDELDLASHGLRYLESEAGSIARFWDGAEPWVFFHEIDRTLDELAATYPHELDGYRRYLQDALPVAELVLRMARTVPSAGELAYGGIRESKGGPRLFDWSRRSAAEVFRKYFSDWHIWMPAVSTGPTVWGVPPEMPGTGLAAALYATRHLIKTGRPSGGSGALTDAALSSFEAAGGRLRASSRVARLLADGERIAGLELSTGERLSAPVVIAAGDPRRVLLDWLGEIPNGMRGLVDEYRSVADPDGYESKIDAVLRSQPVSSAAEKLEARHPGLDLLSPTSVVSPSPDLLAVGHTERARGRVAAWPTLLTNIPSVLDPSMAPGGGEVLSLEVLFTPYELNGGWPSSDEPERWLDLWASTMEPGALDLVTSWRAMTPDVYEREFNLHRGHTPAYQGSPLATLRGKDPELSRYRTPLEGLYLTGAGTFPGAGIFGAAGRNAASVVTRDLRNPVNKARVRARSALRSHPLITGASRRLRRVIGQ